MRNRNRLDLPAARLRVTAVHPKEVRGKERGFISTSPRADFQDRVLFLVGILRNEQQADLALHRDPLFFEFQPGLFGAELLVHQAFERVGAP